MDGLLEIDKNGNLVLTPEALAIECFNKIWVRDKNKDKGIAIKELSLIWLYSHVKSIYKITPEENRIEEIKNDIGLPTKWKADEVILEAIAFFNSKKSIVTTLYEASLKAANDMADYLKNTAELLAERDDKGKPVTTLSIISTSLKAVPIIMRDLKNAHKEVIKESDDSEGKQKGKQSYNTFETGLVFE